MRARARRATGGVLALGLLLLLAGCPTSPDAEPAEPVPVGEPVAFEVIEQTTSSDFGAASATAMAVVDLPAWERLWAAHNASRTPVPAVPVVDFSRHLVVAVFAGPGLGGLTITRVGRRGDEVAVSAERMNVKGCPVLGVIEHSAAMIRVPRPGTQATLQLETVGRGCG
jgi:hypothetical protein